MQAGIDTALTAALARMRQMGADPDDIALLAGAAKGEDALAISTIQHAAASFVAEIELTLLALPDLRRTERLADMIRSVGGYCQADFSRASGLCLYTDEQSLPQVMAAADLFGLRVDTKVAESLCMRLFDPLGGMRRIDVRLRSE